jgi:DNA repair exonuclease SbcCD ATPase subunit
MDTSRYEALQKRYLRLESQKQVLEQRHESLTCEVANLESQLVVSDKVATLFKHLIEQYVSEYAASFSRLVTEGLHTIYHDQDLDFSVDITQKRGKIHAEFITSQEGREGDTLKSFGGGVAALESLLLRVLVMLKEGMAKYLFLDESLGALSVEYVDLCGSFLRQLCDRLGIHILLVTHNESFLEHATRAYQGSLDPKNALRLRKLKGEVTS